MLLFIEEREKTQVKLGRSKPAARAPKTAAWDATTRFPYTLFSTDREEKKCSTPVKILATGERDGCQPFLFMAMLIMRKQ
jgi:hypothetical protein